MMSRAFLYRGLSIAEVIIAFALLAITFISVLAVLAAGIRAEKKGFLDESALSVSDLLQRRILREANYNDPPGSRARFWSVEHPERSNPFASGQEVSGNTHFDYEITTSSVPTSFDTSVGYRLMRVDVYVHWTTDDSRAGYGSTMHHDRFLISEAGGRDV